MIDQNEIQDDDVLFGRGGATNNHIGNKRFRALVSEHQPVYLAAKKRDKSSIARTIVKIIRERGGRFLKKVDDNGTKWEEVGDKKAGEKTSQALREGLDVRVKSTKMPRRDSGDSSASSSTGNQPAKKKRRSQQHPSDSSSALKTATADYIVTSPYGEAQTSPALVSEVGEPQTLPVLREEDFSKARFVFDPPQISSSDCQNVVEV